VKVFSQPRGGKGAKSWSVVGSLESRVKSNNGSGNTPMATATPLEQQNAGCLNALCMAVVAAFVIKLLAICTNTHTPTTAAHTDRSHTFRTHPHMLERIAIAYINLASTKHFRRRKAFRFRFAVLLLLRLLMHWGENMVESLEKRFVGGTSKIARIF